MIRSLSISLMLFAFLLPSSALAIDDFEFMIAPYGMLPSVSGNASMGSFEDVDIDMDAGDIFENLELAGMLRFEVQHKSKFGLILDYAFLDMGADASGPLGFTSLKADIFQGIFQGYLSYELLDDAGKLQLYGGIRWWEVDVDLKSSGPLGNQKYSGGDNWVDPVIGMRWMPEIADRWSLILTGDVGGFGVSSDFSFNVQGGFAWEATDYLSLVLQYRALWVDYETGSVGSSDRFVYDTVTHGPLFGAAFYF
ncbi:MAG: hypothetical protein KDD66_14950 [Bdellovibrionales bacterium]|nr:hypothetical protein [Bdellovibrionales bacterium]